MRNRGAKESLASTLVGLPRSRPECFDAVTLLRRVKKEGFKVRSLEILGPHAPGETPVFVITFNPVMPDKRLPVEKIITKMGLKVEGGGTCFLVKREKGKKKVDLVTSDVSFEFKRTFGKSGADTAVDVIRHLESEIERLRQARFPRKLRRGARRVKLARR